MKNLYIVLLVVMALNAHAQFLKLAEPPKSVSLQFYKNGTWKTVHKDTYTIDASSHVVRFLSEFLEIDSTFEPSGQWTYTYNTEGLEAQCFYESWNKNDNVWNPGTLTQTTYTYNVNNKIEAILQGHLLTNYVYDAGGNLISMECLALHSGTWLLQSRTTYTNNSAGLPTHEFHEGFSNPPTTLKTYTYNSSGKPVELREYVITLTSIFDGARIIWLYDAAGKLVEEAYYNSPLGQWVKYEKYTYTYLPSGRIDYVMHHDYVGTNFEAAERFLYEWFDSYPTTGIREQDNSEDAIVPAVYFDFSGREVQKQKNVILIEQRGEKRRKVIIQE